jgi:prepilin-type N-terminal cleavage/methylation domain-containing protein
MPISQCRLQNPIFYNKYASLQFGTTNTAAKMQINKNMISKVSNRRGFTLLELIVVLALLAILAAVSAPKFIDLSANAEQKALRIGVAELNGRENLVWLDIKNSQIGWVDDTAVFSQIDTNLGPNYHWSPRAEIDGGKLHFKDQMIKLKRIPSTEASAAKWEIIFSSS